MLLRWLFLDLNSYFASVEQAENPKLIGKPVAVVPMMADTTCCLAASYPAKKFGIKTGTSVRDAKRLCPEIVFVKADHRKYVTYHNRILATVEKYLPIKSVLSIDEVACELIGRECNETFIREKSHEIKSAIYREVSPALTCSIGAAPNRYLAKVASDMQKPDGLTILNFEEIRERLIDLKLRDFPGIGPRMEARFLSAGCHSVKQMLQLTVKEMREIWGGVVGDRFFHLIRGENIPEQVTQRGTIGHSKVLAPGSRNVEAAWPVLIRLLTKACIRLRNEKYYAKELQLYIKFPKNIHEKVPKKKAHTWTGTARFVETADTLDLIDELTRLWQVATEEAKTRESTILQVGLVLTHLVPASNRQLRLFEDPRRISLMSALDSINIRYHDNTVYIADAHKAKDIATNMIAFQRIPKENE